MKIQTVQQGAADTGEIAGNCAGATDTPPGRMPKISTGTGVHGGHQHHATRVRNRSAGARDRHPAILDGLPENLHSTAGEFREFIQKQNPIVGKG